MMSIVWRSEPETPILEFTAPGFPKTLHPVEPDLFCRQTSMPGHDQAGIEEAHVVVVGCGGLGSWIALGLARMGVRRLTLVDPDRFDRTNAPRQLMFGADIGLYKSHMLARNTVPHMTNAGIITAIAAPIESVIDEHGAGATVLVVGVDNNAARLRLSSWAQKHARSAVFAMLSLDGMRAQVFLQRPQGPCLTCVLPDLEPAMSHPCAAAAVSSCYLAAAHAIALTAAALGHTPLPMWRETSLNGETERIGSHLLTPRSNCCGPAATAALSQA